MTNTQPNSGHPRCNGPSKSRITLALVVMGLLDLISTAHAQLPLFPVSVQAPSYSRTSTYMYILGGNTTTSQVLGQFYKLDLAVPWKTAAPVWTRLADGPQQFLFPSTWSKDERTLATFHVAEGVLSYLYSATTNTWVQSRLKVSHDGLQGVNAVTDPNTGLAYLAAGYMGARDTMDVYNFGADSMSSRALPSTIFQARSYYGNVWSKKRNSILYFGGYTALMQKIPDQNIVTEYVASTYVWQTMVTSGIAPVMRADHCMASNDDGTQVVIYGGRFADLSVTNDLYILNTVSQTWEQGTSGPYRLYSACTIAGDLLIVWAGLDQTLNKPDTDMLVYNITSKLWQSEYTPPASYIAARQNETAGPDSGVPGGIDTGAPSPPRSQAVLIAGASVGGVAVICIIVLLALIHNRRKNNRGSPVDTKGDEDRSVLQRSRGVTPQQQRHVTRESEEELQNLRAQIQTHQEEIDLHRRLLLLQQQQQQQQRLQLQQNQQQILQRPYTHVDYTSHPPMYSPGLPSNIFTHDPEKAQGLAVYPSGYPQVHPNSYAAMDPYPSNGEGPSIGQHVQRQPSSSSHMSHMSRDMSSSYGLLESVNHAPSTSHTPSRGNSIGTAYQGHQSQSDQPPKNPQFGARER
ncbi:hypothetical protein CPC16_007666 [Podila verticillata]|nr:hypothetical protein CPC16_007666 [Podila verticillata]